MTGAEIESSEVTCGACPVQIEGRLRDGRFFYFRARHDAAQLGAHRDGPDAAVEASMRVGKYWPRKSSGQFVERDHVEEAGFLSEAEARALLAGMLAELPGPDL